VNRLLKQKGKLDLDYTLTHAQYFYESKETSEREYTTDGNKTGKKDFRVEVKAVNIGDVAKPKAKPSENNYHRNLQDKPPFNNP